MSARRTTNRTAAAVATLALGAAALAGCAGGASTATATPSAASGGSSAASVDPNAPEPAAAGDIPDDQAFVPFSPQGAASTPFTVSVPEGWSRTSSGASSTTFTDKLNSVTIDVSQQSQAPTVASVEGTELAKVSAAATGYQAGKTQQVTRKAGTAIESTYRADAAPDPVTGKVVSDDVSRYVYFKDGTEVVLVLAGPHGADNVDPWRTVTDSFAWTAQP